MVTLIIFEGLALSLRVAATTLDTAQALWPEENIWQKKTHENTLHGPRSQAYPKREVSEEAPHPSDKPRPLQAQGDCLDREPCSQRPLPTFWSYVLRPGGALTPGWL